MPPRLCGCRPSPLHSLKNYDDKGLIPKQTSLSNSSGTRIFTPCDRTSGCIHMRSAQYFHHVSRRLQQKSYKDSSVDPAREPIVFSFHCYNVVYVLQYCSG